MSVLPRALLALAWRESRFARRHLLLFLSSISLGVAALVATQSFAANLARGVREQSRALLGADASLSSNRPFPAKTETLLRALPERGARVARVVSFASMARVPGTGAARLAQVRAVEPGFPFYGAIETRPAGQWSTLVRGRNLLADPALLAALGARVGDSLALGEARFRVIGVLTRVPGEVGLANLVAPRVYIPVRFLGKTKLLQLGSRVRYEAFVRFGSTAAPARLLAAARPTLRAERVRVTTAEGQQRELDEALGRLGSYLGLIGTFALLLGGIGVASGMGAYMARKRETVATLRCVGATTGQVITIYLLQALVMGAAGALLGAALGASVQWVLPGLARGLLPIQVETRLDAAALATGIGVGTVIAVAFALLPLLATRHVSPLEALRRRMDTATGGNHTRDPWLWATRAVIAAGVLVLVTVQLGSWRQGALIAAGVAATLLALAGAAWLLARGLARLRGAALAYPERQGLANLHRPGSQTRAVMVALGFGVFLLATLALVRENLLRPLRPGGSGARANLVLFDVQEDQEPGVRAMLRASGVAVLQRAPIVPMRVAEINGRAPLPPAPRDAGGADPERAGEERSERGGGERRGGPEGWALRREYRSTFRDTLVRSERLLTGRWWRPGATNEVSLEKEIAGELGVRLGDRITWDVQGVRIATRVTSLREVDWRRLEPNFFAVFPTAALVGAPQTWVELGRAPDAAVRARVQRDVVRRYSNVSIIDLTQLQAALDEVLGRVALVIRFLSGFSIATGLVVLAGAVLASRLQRLRESVLLRTLGATRRQIARILLAEYAALGLASALAGTTLAIAAGWALCRWLFKIEFGVPLSALLWLAVGSAALAAAIGVWGSREVFRGTPLESLREE